MINICPVWFLRTILSRVALTVMSLDAGLLQRNIQSQREKEAANRSGDLRLARRGSSRGDNNEQSTLRQRVMAARRDKSAKESKTKQVVKAAVAPARKATSRLLRQAWINVIDSYGLTLLWVDVHFFMSAVLGDSIFCKPGHEWADAVSGGKAGGQQTAEQLESAQQAIGLVEKGLIGCVNIVLLLTIFSIAFVLYLLIDKNPIIIFIIKLMDKVL